VLARLAVPLGQPVSRAALTDLLWDDVAPGQARDSFRHALADIRKALGPDTERILRTDGDTIALEPGAARVDVADFERLLRDGSPAALEAAAARYTGDLLDGFDVSASGFETWVRHERERLRRLAGGALQSLLTHYTAAGEPARAVDAASRLLALDPLDESAHRALMRLYASQGQRAFALRQYQACVATLEQEVHAEPEPATKALYRELVRTEPAHQATERARSAAAGTRQAPARDDSAPFVGRESELERLRAVTAEAVAGRARVVVILGEPGIGKSSLLDRAAATARELGARVLTGHAYPGEQILPFGPWIDAFRRAGVTEHDTLWAKEQPAQIFESVVALVDRLAAEQPLALMLEDVHWADDESLRLLAVVSRRLASRRFLAVVTAREEELAERPAVRELLAGLARGAALEMLTLGPLSRAEIGALVRAVARHDKAPAVEGVADRAWATSEGHPFMAVETVRALEQGAAPSPTAGLALPERVRELVTARLDRVSERGRRLLGAAAVIGRDFEYPLLERAVAGGDEDVAAGVEELVRRRLLRAAGERFEFTHARIREVAYAQLLAVRRRLLHHAVGSALETLYSSDLDPHWVALGTHYYEGGAWEKATGYLERAGQHALARAAVREAAMCFERAIEANDRLDISEATLRRAVNLRVAWLQATIFVGHVPRLWEVLQDAQDLAERLGDRVRLGSVLFQRAYFSWRRGRTAEARAHALRLRAIGEETHHERLIVLGLYVLGAAEQQAGDYAAAGRVVGELLARLPEAESLKGRDGGLMQHVNAHALAAAIQAHLGDADAAMAANRAAVALAERVGHHFLLIAAYWWHSEICLIQTDPAADGLLLERAVALARDWEVPRLAPVATAALGWTRFLAGRRDEGRALMREALAAYERTGIAHSLFLVRLGEVTLEAGDLDAADRLATRALALAQERGERGLEALALRLHGEIAARRGDARGAEKALREARERATELGMRPLAEVCRRDLDRAARA